MISAILSFLSVVSSATSGADAAPAPKRLEIELLYLDLSQCTRCMDTGTRVEDALALLAPVLKETGWDVSFKRVHVTTEAQARELRFTSSPTVRINGRDSQLDSRESLCGDCGKLCESAEVTCREWRYGDKWFTSPPRALFVEAILAAMHAPAQVPTAIAPCCAKEPAFEVPANLKRFFAARKTEAKTAGCCSPEGATPKKACCDTSATTEPKKSCCESGSACCGSGK